MTDNQTQTDKEKALYEQVKPFVEEFVKEITRLNDKIDTLQASERKLQLLIDKQFQLLCTYANLCKKEEREENSESEMNYTKLENLLEEYGYQNFSYMLRKEVALMEYNYRGLKTCKIKNNKKTEK